MLKLESPADPVWIDTPSGVRFHMKPADAVMLIAARRTAGQVKAAGGSQAEAEFAFTAAAVAWGVIEWDGVGGDEGDPVPPTEENVGRLLRQELAIFDQLDRDYVLPELLKDAEKNASSPSPTGTSAGAKTTAGPAPRRAKPAPTSKTSPSPTPESASGT